MSITVQQVAILACFMLVGWILSKKNIVKTEHSELLSKLMVWVFFPCKLFSGFSSHFTVPYLADRWVFLPVSFAVLVCIVTVLWLIVPKVVKTEEMQRIVRYSLTVPNFGYMGYALCESLFGGEMMLDMMIYGLPVSMYTYTEGYRLLTSTGKISLKRLVNPVFVAILIGCIVGVAGIPIPHVLQSVVSQASGCVAPVSMLLAGITVSEFPLKQLLFDKTTYVVTFLRLLVIPIGIGFILSRFCPANIVLPAMMCFCMPCGMNTVVFPKLVGGDCRPGASLAIVSTALSILTIPVCIECAKFFVK